MSTKKKHEHCSACALNHGEHDHSHDRYNHFTEKLGNTLEDNVAIQVLDALKTQSDELFEQMLAAMTDNPWAFIEILNITMDE